MVMYHAGIYAHLESVIDFDPTVHGPKFIFLPGCNESLRAMPARYRCYGYPVSWLPEEWRTKSKIEKVVKMLNELGATLKLLYIGETEGMKGVKYNINFGILSCIRQGCDYEEQLVTTNKWVFLQLENPINAVYCYYVHCLVRHLFCATYNKMFLDIEKIQAAEPDIPTFEAFQIAHYANPHQYSGGKGFLHQYQGQKMLTIEQMLTSFSNGVGLNNTFKTEIKKPYGDIFALYEKGLFKEIQTILR